MYFLHILLVFRNICKEKAPKNTALSDPITIKDINRNNVRHKRALIGINASPRRVSLM